MGSVRIIIPEAPEAGYRGPDGYEGRVALPLPSFAASPSSAPLATPRLGPAALALALVGGGLQALAFLVPALWWAAWLGIACLAAAASVPARARWLALGLLAAQLISFWGGFPWHVEAEGRYMPGGPGWAWAWVVPISLVWPLPERLPLVLAFLLGRRLGLPAWAWLPAGWWLGEAWWDAFGGVSYDAWLYGQWQAPVVLRSVGNWGWDATLLACLAASAAAGEAIALGAKGLAARAWRPGLVALAACAFLAAAPPLDPGRPDLLADVGVVHLHDYATQPKAPPPGVRLLIWPEGVTARTPRLAEGPARGEQLWPLMKAAPTTFHAYGAPVRNRQGRFNGLVAVDPAGRAVAMRAKSRLFPLLERPSLGLKLPQSRPYQPGTASPVMQVAGKRFTALLCLEELDRALVARGAREGSELIVVSANDYILGADPMAHRQLLATAVFRAVEAHTPLVRASIYGSAAFIGADGRILAEAPLGGAGVLTLAGEHPCGPASPAP